MIVFACLAGLLTGLYSSDLTDAIKPIGELYLSILNMCVLPIIICAIISGIGALFNKTDDMHNVRKMLLLFLTFITLSCVTGLICSFGVIKSFDIGESLNEIVGTLMVDNDSQGGMVSGGMNFQSVIYDITTETPPATEEESGFTVFVKKLITENIFESLASKKIAADTDILSSFFHHAQTCFSGTQGTDYIDI